MPSISLISKIKSKVKHQGEVAACKIKVDTAEALGVAVHDTTPLVSLKAEASELFKSGDTAAEMKLRRFEDAIADSKRSVEADPNYSRGYERLATAQLGLHRYNDAYESYGKAIALLDDISEPTSADIARKVKIEQALAEAQRKEAGPDVLLIRNATGSMPWDKAAALRPSMNASDGTCTSAWIILEAHELFNKGCEALWELQRTETSEGTVIYGRLGAVVNITDGLLRDERAFHMTTPDWKDRYGYQAQYEAMEYNAWINQADEATIMREIRERVAGPGWDNVRPALDLTVRAWIMHAFLLRSIPDYNTAVHLLQKVQRFLTWGDHQWPDVPTSQRGVIFEHTFRRSVKRLYLHTLYQAIINNPGPNSPFSLAELKNTSAAILEDVEQHPPESEDKEKLTPGYIAAYWLYPTAEALIIDGFYHMQLALTSVPVDPVKQKANFRLAYEKYLSGAERFPKDDENHAYYLKSALECLMESGATLTETLPLMERVRKATPLMKNIWETSGMALCGRDAALQAVISFEEGVQKQLKDGTLTMNDSVTMPIRETSNLMDQ
ncbi:negative ER-associated ubiquitin-dependent protein catabolic process [Rhizoctonia solani]|uniref:Negative ER-associated ubiquitin-dependent protein catabolic process n=1 Tax=Rhizoctonia solani TaxID=456999 RepID=A0A8H7IH34_9AGAM|nr:negative ER-associated ubiquitin-dependent protein catabolic process [Rhizoctonia solani]